MYKPFLKIPKKKIKKSQKHNNLAQWTEKKREREEKKKLTHSTSATATT